MSNDWDSLDVKEKIMLVTTDIMHLLDRLCEKTKPGGELDSVIETASESFGPLGELLQINLEEEDDKHISLNTLSQGIASGFSILTPEVENLLGISFNPQARNADGSQREQIDHNVKRIDELLDRRNSRRSRASVIEKVSSKHSPVKDLAQPGPSGLQARRKDVSVGETFPKQRFRVSFQPGPSSTSHSSEDRRLIQHSEDLSQPGPSGISAFAKQAARSPEKSEGNISLSRRSRIELQTQQGLSDLQARREVSVSEKVLRQGSRGVSLQGLSEILSEVTSEERRPRQHSEDLRQSGPSGISASPKQAARSPEKSEENVSLSRRSRIELQTQLGLRDLRTKRKDVSFRRKFSKKRFKRVDQQGPSESSSEVTSNVRQSRHHSKELHKPDSEENMLLKHSSAIQSDSKISKRNKSSSIFKSYSHYSSDEWERGGDESENVARRSSTIY